MGRGGGFHRYATSLVRALHAAADNHEYVLFVNRSAQSLFPAGGRFEKVVVPLPPQRQVWPFRIVWQQLLLPLYVRRFRLELVHYPFDTATILPGCPYVVTMHDLIADVHYPTRFPGSISRIKSAYLLRAKRLAARRAAAVICPSEATAKDVVKHYGVARERITVIPEAPAHQFVEAAQGERDRNNGSPAYVLSVVSLSTHKNVETLVRAFARARASYGFPHELCIVGMPGTGSRRIRRFLAHAVPSDVPVRYMGYLEESALAKMYREAALLAYIPWVEGFGLPPLEAMALGVPVVASNVSSLPEVCGSAALLVPPGDVDAVAEAIGRVLTDETVAKRLSDAGRCHAGKFSWAQVARETRALYQRVATTTACP